MYTPKHVLYNAKADYQEENALLDQAVSADSPALHYRDQALVYTVVTAVCFIFARVYYQFSHDVYSNYMTYAYLIPLILGWIPSIALWRLAPLRRSGPVAINAYHSGVAAVTVSSILRGIFAIAGNASDYQLYLLIAGLSMLVTGLIAYVLRR